MDRENIQPCAWRAIGGSIWGHKTSDDDSALYDQDALDAAVSAERERCAKLCEDRRDRELLSASTAHAMAADDCAKSIRRA
jgi:hypothetical protein